ncbi:MAG: MFS transporter [Ardenticatenaceae bacterium]|nr:MFS transporter [Ardenticatenaceae bacterium]
MISELSRRLGVNRIVLALSAARLADALGNSILFIIIPLYVAKLPAPWFPFPESVRVGLLISLYGFFIAVLQPVMGALADRYGRFKLFIQLGLVTMGIATLAFVFASRFVDLLLLRALQGVGVSLTVPASLALMAIATEKETRGGSMGVFSSMRMVGFAIGPLLGGYLHVHYGFDTAFLLGAAAIFLGMLLVHFLVREPETAVSSSTTPAKFQIIDRKLWTVGMIGLGLATFIMAADFSMMTTLENEFNQRLTQTAVGFGLAFSALMVSRLIFQIPLGRWSDRIGRKPLIIGGTLLLAPSTLMLGLAGTTLQLTGYRLLQGLASAAVAAPAFALAADISHQGGEGRQLSVITMGFGLGIAVGPLVAGLLAVIFFELPFLVGGLFSLLGAWIVYQYVPESVQRGQKKRPSPEPSQHTAD